MYRSAIPAGPSRSSDKRICEHSERRDARGPPDVCLRDCHKRLQTLESPGIDLRRTEQALSYDDLPEHRRRRYPHVFTPDKRTIPSRRPHFIHTGRDSGSLHLLQAEDSFSQLKPRAELVATPVSTSISFMVVQSVMPLIVNNLPQSLFAPRLILYFR